MRHATSPNSASRTLGLVCVLALIPVTASAGDLASVRREAAARHSAAFRTAGQLTVMLEGFVTEEDGEYRVSVLYRRKGDRWRWDETRTPVQHHAPPVTTSLFGDAESLMNVVFDRTAQPRVGQRASHAPIAAAWQSLPESALLVGEATTQDKDCWLVELTPHRKEGPRRLAWIDKRRFVLLQGEATAPGYEARTVLSDWSSEAGVDVPNRIVMMVAGRPVLQFQVTKASKVPFPTEALDAASAPR